MLHEASVSPYAGGNDPPRSPRRQHLQDVVELAKPEGTPGHGYRSRPLPARRGQDDRARPRHRGRHQGEPLPGRGRAHHPRPGQRDHLRCPRADSEGHRADEGIGARKREYERLNGGMQKALEDFRDLAERRLGNIERRRFWQR